MKRAIAILVMCAVGIAMALPVCADTFTISPPNIYIWDEARPYTVADGNYALSTFNTLFGGTTETYQSEWYSQNVYFEGVGEYDIPFLSYDVSTSSTDILTADININQNLIFNEQDVYRTFQFVQIYWVVRLDNYDDSETLSKSDDPYMTFNASVDPLGTVDQTYYVNTTVVATGTAPFGGKYSLMRSTFEVSEPIFNFRHNDASEFVNATFHFRTTVSSVTAVEFGILGGYIGVSPIYAGAWGNDNINWNAILDGMPDVDFIYRFDSGEALASNLGDMFGGLTMIAFIILPILSAFVSWRIVRLFLHKE